ncbi:hypothetical protein L1D50_20750 [Pseudoalteromonas sp. Isolate6]|uniref:hypothetical protein n=1 Tax=Pseudoalteromonas sp. Isolate6 TaxID=2908527 RepID=UPI001EFC5656|nr:hypothetical protein [Pseudoalteromonas sp. Isolate6]MCG9761511.1 hypothetical protein [Pseudoalteromonas sp. Isolate6]
MKLIFTFIAGLLAGIFSVVAFLFLESDSTEIWKSQVELTTESGMVIPVGTELVLSEYMPEGYVALSLDVNVEGSELNLFDKSEVDKSNLRSPLWVRESN